VEVEAVVVVGHVEMVVEELGYLEVVVEAGVQLLLRLLLLFLLVVVRENWLDLAVARDPQVVVRVLQSIVQAESYVYRSSFHLGHRFP